MTREFTAEQHDVIADVALDMDERIAAEDAAAQEIADPDQAAS